MKKFTLTSSMKDVLDDNTGSIIAISKNNLKNIFKTITDLEDN